jgi:hypothetical protein
VRGAARERWVKERTGKTDSQWWREVEPFLTEALTREGHKYPVAMRVGAATAEVYGGAHDPRGAFAFGLERVLDGLAVFIDRHVKRRHTRRR